MLLPSCVRMAPPPATQQTRARTRTRTGASNRQHQQQQTEQAAPTANSTLLWPRPAPHCLVLVARHLDDEHDNGRCVSTVRHALRVLAACCTLMHQGAVGLRGGCQRDWVGTSASSPTPSPKPQPVTQSLSSPSVKSVRQGSRAVGQAQLSGGKECAAHLSSCTPPRCCPVGGVSGCLGCLENFSETPGHPVCFGLCSTHHTPSAHPHHTTPHHSTAITTTVQHALHVHTYPPHPCTLARMPGCASARSDVAWSLLRDKASPAAMPWGSPKAAQGSCRFACVLVESRKAAPPLPSFIYQVHNPLNHNFTSTWFLFSLDIPDSGPDSFYNNLTSTRPPPAQPIYTHSSLYLALARRTRHRYLPTPKLEAHRRDNLCVKSQVNLEKEAQQIKLARAVPTTPRSTPNARDPLVPSV